MKLSEKVAYLKGLEEGLNLDTANAETKLLKGIIEAFDEIVTAIDTNANDIAEMTDRVDEIDMDLGDLEALLFEGFDVEELTEDDLDDDEAFVVVSSDDEDVVEEAEDVVEEAPVEEEVVEEAPVEEELDDAAIFAAADEFVAEAEATEEPETSGIAWPEEEAVEEVAAPVEEVVEEPVEEVVEREAAPEEATYEVECPSCNHVMYIDDSILAQGGVVCPNCHEKLEFEIEYED